jgi:hypothetical protein
VEVTKEEERENPERVRWMEAIQDVTTETGMDKGQWLDIEQW